MDLGDGLGTDAHLSEILKRLPVKSLVRFRAVSKPWSHLINDPFFLTYHLQFTKSSSPSSSVLGITFRLDDYREKELDQDQQFEYFRIDHTEDTKTTLEHLKIPFLWRLKTNPKPEPKTKGPLIAIRGHYNGLILAFDSQTFYVDECTPKFPSKKAIATGKVKSIAFHVDRYVICNPIARRFLILPESTVEIPNLYIDVKREQYHEHKKLNAIGFGFIDDVVYKVVRVTYGMQEVKYQHIEGFKPYEPPWVEAYDSGSCCWRRVPMNSDFSYQELNDGVYNSFDGCLYWVGRGYGNRERYSILVSFHLVDETWHETLLPYKSRYGDEEHHEDGVFGEYGVCQIVQILGESVVMLVGDVRNRLVRDVWKMNKEDDSKVSWTHMYRLVFDGSPLGFTGDGELLLMLEVSWTEGWRKMVLHDSKKMNDACFGFTDLNFKVGNVIPNFVESLVLLDGEFIEDASEETYYFPEEPRKCPEEPRKRPEEPEKPGKRVWEEEEEFGDLQSMFDNNLGLTSI